MTVASPVREERSSGLGGSLSSREGRAGNVQEVTGREGDVTSRDVLE